MKIDFENDLNQIKSSIKKARIAYILTATLILISNLIFIFVSNYYNQTILTIISILIDIILIISLYIEIYIYLIRFKDIYKYLMSIKDFNNEEETGKLVKISQSVLLRKNIYIKEATFNINGKNKIYYLLNDLYNFADLATNNNYVFTTKDKVMVEIKNEH